jgi:hypothetical protein
LIADYMTKPLQRETDDKTCLVVFPVAMFATKS